MPRNKEYDRTDVIKSASGVFFRKGYEATSMSDLVSATGLNTASMYKEFGNKEGLYEVALDTYRETQVRWLIHEMEDNPSLDALKNYLHNLKQYASRPDYIGCLLMNNLTDTSIASEGTIERVKNLCSSLETAIEQCLIHAQSQQQISADKDPKQLAEFISCFVHGIVLYARMHDSKAKLDTLFDQISRMINE